MGDGKRAASHTPLVICLAAGNAQRPVIAKARQLGFDVLGVDQNSDATAADLCCHLIPLSTHDPQPVINAVHDYLGTRTPAAVLNRSSGPPVITAAALCEAFGLPGVPVQRARQCLNKDLLRAECQRLELFTVPHLVADKFKTLNCERVPLPCVLKPALSLMGKNGVMVVEEKSQLAEAFARAQAASLTGQVVMEKYLPGRDVSVIALVHHGKVEILALLDEINERQPDGGIRGRAMAVPSVVWGTPDQAKVEELVRQVADAFEIHHSPLLVSCRVPASGEPQLVEIHLDMGGDQILDSLLPAAGTHDVLGHMIRVLAGEKSSLGDLIWHPTAVLFDPGARASETGTGQLLQATTVQELADLLAKKTGRAIQP